MTRNYLKNEIDRQDARNARVRVLEKSPFLATLAPWRFKIISVFGRFGDF